jgi:hypothetical protein
MNMPLGGRSSLALERPSCSVSSVKAILCNSLQHDTSARSRKLCIYTALLPDTRLLVAIGYLKDSRHVRYWFDRAATQAAIRVLHQLWVVFDHAAKYVHIEAGVGFGLTPATDKVMLKLILSKDLNSKREHQGPSPKPRQ